jgi:hypothetical protein
VRLRSVGEALIGAYSLAQARIDDANDRLQWRLARTEERTHCLTAHSLVARA